MQHSATWQAMLDAPLFRQAGTNGCSALGKMIAVFVERSHTLFKVQAQLILTSTITVTITISTIITACTDCCCSRCTPFSASSASAQRVPAGAVSCETTHLWGSWEDWRSAGGPACAATMHAAWCSWQLNLDPVRCQHAEPLAAGQSAALFTPHTAMIAHIWDGVHECM